VTNYTSQPRCRTCNAPLRFRKLPSGKWEPLDPDGGSHFATCPGRKRNKYSPHVCIACGSTNVEQGPGTGPHHAKLRCLDCNNFRWLPRPVEP